MKTTITTKFTLLISGLIVAGIGFAILIFPAPFYATNGIELGVDPSLLNEIRASGGALIGVGGLVLAGLFLPKLTTLSLTIAAVMYGVYGISRLFSMAVDGQPSSGLVFATAFELVVAMCCLYVLKRDRNRKRSEPSFP